MTLPKTKEILKRLTDRYGDTLHAARLDIKPDYSKKGYGISHGVGYSYNGVDDMDRDFIYQAIGTLAESVNDRPIIFDIDHYITDAKAVKALDEMGNLILEDLLRLRELKIKYQDTECSHYPLKVCLAYHEEVYSILDEIFKSDEYLLRI